MKPKNLKSRLSKIFSHAKGVQKILLVNTNSQDPNFIYLTDFHGGLFEGSFLLAEKKKVILFTYALEYETAMKQKTSGMEVVKISDKKSMDRLIKNVKGSAVGINESFVPYDTYKRIRKRMKPKKLVDITGAFAYARETKDDDEIARIKVANNITKRAIAEVQKRLKEGVTEREVAADFNNTILRLGADSTSFDSIVCFGTNAAMPHHMPDNTKLKYGDFVLIDVGVKVRNYCSDVTRTIIFGSDSRRIKNYERKLLIVNTVKEAQRMAIAKIKEGAVGNDVHMAAENHINKADNGKFKGTFIHSLGHSIGIEVHDGSGRFLSPGSKLILKKGMITSVEPGIYIPGFGGARFEDDILVTKKSSTIL